MAEKTIVDKAGKTVGIGIAMASDVAGAIKTAIGSALTTMTEVLKKDPVKAPAKETATKKVRKKTAPKKVGNKTVTKKAATERSAGIRDTAKGRATRRSSKSKVVATQSER
jgi:ribosomal protein S5